MLYQINTHLIRTKIHIRSTKFLKLLLLTVLYFRLSDQAACLNPKCITCADDQVTCIGCSAGTFLNQVDNECDWCQGVNGLGLCYKCNSDATTCQQCYRPAQLIDGKCVGTSEPSETNCQSPRIYTAHSLQYRDKFTCVQQCRQYEAPNSNNICKSCPNDLGIAGCINCSIDIGQCTKCKVGNGLVNNICQQCMSSCINCQSDASKCAKCDQGYSYQNNICTAYCGNLLVKIDNEDCDLGLGVPNDGCTDTCGVEPDFECKIDGTRSICSYDKQIELTIAVTPVKIPENETNGHFDLTVNVDRSLYVFDCLSADQLISLFSVNDSSVEIESVSWEETSQSFTIRLNYTQDIGGDYFKLTISPSESINESFYKTPPSHENFQVLRECPANCDFCTWKLPVQCTKCSQYYDIKANGQCGGICGDFHVVDQDCDLGLGVPNDGCTDTCGVEPDFECKIDGTRSICSYDKQIELTIAVTPVKIPENETNGHFDLTVNVDRSLYVFDCLSADQLISLFSVNDSSVEIESVSWEETSQSFTIRLNYTQDIGGDYFKLTISPSESINESFYKTPPSHENFQVLRECPANCDFCTWKLPVQCTKCSQYYDIKANGQCGGICGDFHVVDQDCDLGLGVPNDGCTDTCGVEPDFECKIDGTRSICSYDKQIELTIAVTPVKIPENETNGHFDLTVNVDRSLYVFDCLSADQLIFLFSVNDSSVEIESVSWEETSQSFTIRLNYTQDIGGDYFKLTISPSESINESFYKTPPSHENFQVLRECPANCDFCTWKLPVQCTKCSQYYDIKANGQCGGICGDFHVVDQDCDLGLGVPNDGCTDTCGVEPDFECKIDGTRSICSYDKQIELTIAVTPVKIPENETNGHFDLTVNVDRSLYVFDCLSADQLISLFSVNDSSVEIESVSWEETSQSFTIRLNYTQDIGGDYFKLTISPSESINESFYKTPPSHENFQVLRECPANCDFCTWKLPVQCTKCSQYYDIKANGQCGGICGDFHVVDQDCDLGLGVPNDGCTDTCGVEPDFECKIDGTRSICSYKLPINIFGIKIQHSLYSHLLQLHISMKLSPPLNIFQSIDFKNLIQLDDALRLISVEWDSDNSKLQLIVAYSQEIINQSFGFKLVPSVNIDDSFFATQQSKDTLTIESEDLSNFFYTQSQLQQISVIDGLCWCIIVIAGIAWIVGLPVKNLAGIEAMMCIQFCWMARLWNTQRLPFHYFLVNPLKYSTIYNYSFQPLSKNPQMNFAFFSGFSTEFFHCNINVSLILALIIGIFPIVSKVRLHLQQREMEKKQTDTTDQQSERVQMHAVSTSQNRKEPTQAIEEEHISIDEESEEDEDLELVMNSKILVAIQNYEKSVEIYCYASVTIYLSFVNCTIAFFVFGELSSAISIACLAIGALSFIPSVYFFCFDPYLTGIFCLSFKCQKPLRQFHYAFVVLLFTLTVGLFALKQYAWAPLIPISMLALETIILRPYQECRDNLRFLFLLFMAAYAVSINVAIQQAELPSDISIPMLLVLLVLLLVVSLWSFVSVLRSGYIQYQRRSWEEQDEMIKDGEIQDNGQSVKKMTTLVRALKMTGKDLKRIMALMLENKEDVFKYYKAINEKRQVFDDMEMTGDKYCKEMCNELLTQKKIEFNSLREASSKKPNKISYKKMAVFSNMKKEFEKLYGECENPYQTSLTQRERRHQSIKRKQEELKRMEDIEERRKMSIEKFAKFPRKVQDRLIMLIINNDLYIKLAYAIRRSESDKKPVNEKYMKAYNEIELKKKKKKQGVEKHNRGENRMEQQNK